MSKRYQKSLTRIENSDILEMKKAKEVRNEQKNLSKNNWKKAKKIEKRAQCIIKANGEDYGGFLVHILEI